MFFNIVAIHILEVMDFTIEMRVVVGNPEVAQGASQKSQASDH
jgi:hypothetical protein